MKSMRKRNLWMIAVLISIFLLLPVALFVVEGGTEEAPEIQDAVGDTEDNFKDITKVWVESEDLSQFTVVYQVAGSPKEWERGSLLSGNITTFNYEFYFSFNNTNYSATAVVSVAFNLFGVQDIVLASGELREVYYVEGTDNVANESYLYSLSVSWDQSRTSLVFQIPKDMIGDPREGEAITHLWAAVWNDDQNPYDEQRNLSDAVDFACTYSAPGEDYIFTGGYEYVYEMRFTTDKTNLTVSAGESLSVPITVIFNTTSEENVSATFSAVVTGVGSATLEPDNATFNGSSTLQITLTFTAPNTVTNLSVTMVTITGEMEFVENGVTGHKDAEPLYLNITVEPAKKEEHPTSSGILDKIIGFFKSPVGMGITLAVILVLIGVAFLVRSGKRYEMEMMGPGGAGLPPYPPGQPPAQPYQVFSLPEEKEEKKGGE